MKILQYLDFLKGYKTKIGSFALVISVVLNLVQVDISQVELVELFGTLVDETEIIVSAGLVIYGAIMKLIRKFKCLLD